MVPEFLVLFDIDGTLLIGAGSGRAATELAMREVFGTVGALADYTFSGKTDYYTLVELLRPEGFTEAQIVEALPHYSHTLTRHMKDIVGNYSMHALPGTLELVRKLAARSDVLLAILTGNVPQMADLKLGIAGFDPAAFAFGVYGTEGRIRRELAPIALDRARQYSGVSFAGSNVVMVGDTPDDIDCARSVGARIIAVATGFTPRADLERHHPDALLDTLADVPLVLKLILQGRFSVTS